MSLINILENKKIYISKVNCKEYKFCFIKILLKLCMFVGICSGHEVKCISHSGSLSKMFDTSLQCHTTAMLCNIAV